MLSLPYTLPSRGILYQGAIPDGNVIILPIRGEQEELFAGSGKQNHIVLLHHLISELVQFPQKFNSQDLLINDWFALLINIFSFSYGPDVKLNPTCPGCNKSVSVSKKMTDLKCVMAPTGAKWQEPFDTEELPMEKHKVTFRMLRMRDWQIIENFSSEQSRFNLPKNKTETYTLAQHIIAINGNQNMTDMEKMSWIEKALGGDLRVFRRAIKEKETGYNTRTEVACPECNAKFAVELPLDFFRSLGS
jgi:hypothetical protein